MEQRLELVISCWEDLFFCVCYALVFRNGSIVMHIYQWCSKTSKLHDQDHFFKTKTAFFQDHQIINPRPLA